MPQTADQTATNGRQPDGKFGPGNRAAAGRSSKAAALRKAFLDAIKVEDVAAIAAKLVSAAKGGDVQCAKLILDRLGKPQPDDHADDAGRNRILSMLATEPPGDGHARRE